MNAVDFTLWLQQFSSPGLDLFFHAVTNLGHEYAYIAILLIVYWCVDRRIGHRLALVFLSSIWLNGYLKELFQTARPAIADGVRVLVVEESFGFPSGHAQGSATLWGSLALSFRSAGFAVVAALLVALIGLSRVYLGAHYVGDVLGGWAAAALILALFAAAEALAARVRLSRRTKLLAAVLLPLLLVPLYQSDHSFQALGVMMGWMASDAFALEAIGYRPKVSLARQGAKLLLGFLGVGILLGLHSLLPEGLLEAFGYALISLWVTVGAPLLFLRLGLGGTDDRAGDVETPSQTGLRRLLQASAGVAVLLAALTLLSPRFEPEVASLPVSSPSERPSIIAHRGGAGLAPENTLEAFALGSRMSDALELDVRMTADGALVVIHDESVDRTTDGTGKVREMSTAQLKALDAGYWFTHDGVSYPYRGRGVRIPLLIEVIEAFPDTPLLIEIKDDEEEAALALAELLAAEGASERVVVGSFHDRVIAAFRRASPATPTTAATGEAIRFLLMSRLGLDHFAPVPYQVLSVPPGQGRLTVITGGFVEAAHRKGLQVSAWTVNEPAEAERLAALGVDGIITDYPDRLPWEK